MTPQKSECPLAGGQVAKQNTQRNGTVSPVARSGNTRPIESVLSRLDKVRQGASGQWMACCPAHEDKTPSLSVGETPDGWVLLNCFAGCTLEEILGALGLEVDDLYPPRGPTANAPKRTAKVITASQALELLHDEAQFLAIYGLTLSKGAACTEGDRARALAAAGRVAFIRDKVMQ